MSAPTPTQQERIDRFMTTERMVTELRDFVKDLAEAANVLTAYGYTETQRDGLTLLQTLLTEEGQPLHDVVGCPACQCHAVHLPQTQEERDAGAPKLWLARKRVSETDLRAGWTLEVTSTLGDSRTVVPTPHMTDTVGVQCGWCGHKTTWAAARMRSVAPMHWPA